MESNAKRRLFVAVAGVAAGILGSAGSAKAVDTILLSENFDTLPLGPFVSPTESGGSGQDWTATPPAGWTVDNSGLPIGNPVEFQGFTFMTKASWIATEGNQDRISFTKGTNTVMVADPDAYDDGTTIEPAQFNPKITTPQIPLTSAVTNTLLLQFSSSFRPYDGMTATVEVSFDSGAFQNILTYDTANSGGDSSLLRVDEDVTINVANPAGAGTAQFRFGMSEAGNDWWWAVDNVQVNANVVVPEPTSAALVGLGLAALAGRRKRPAALK